MLTTTLSVASTGQSFYSQIYAEQPTFGTRNPHTNRCQVFPCRFTLARTHVLVRLLQELVKALISLCQISVLDGEGSQDDDTVVFFLELLIRVVLQNRLYDCCI